LLAARSLNLNKTHATLADRFKLVVVAEPWDVLADFLGGGYETLPSRNGVPDAVDDDVH
jgi:hypothetical protein